MKRQLKEITRKQPEQFVGTIANLDVISRDANGAVKALAPNITANIHGTSGLSNIEISTAINPLDLRLGDEVLITKVHDRFIVYATIPLSQRTGAPGYTEGYGSNDVGGAPQPTTLTAIISGKWLKLEWDAVPRALYYQVIRSKTQATGDAESEVIAETSNTSYDTRYRGEDADPNMWYSVVAITRNGQASSMSDWVQPSVTGAPEAGFYSENLTSSVSGELIISKSSNTLRTDFTTFDSPTPFFVEINDPANGHSNTQPIDNGSILYFTNKNGNKVFAKVVSAQDRTTYWRYKCTKVFPAAGTNRTVQANSTVVNYGVSGDGYIYQTADNTNAPFISIRTHTAEAGSYPIQTSPLELTRFGNLNGNWGYNTDIFGFAVGKYASNQPNITIDATNGLRMRNYTTDIITFDISGNASIAGAMNVNNGLSVGTGGYLKSGASAYNSGTGFWLEYNGGTPRLFIGNSAGNKMTWDGSSLSVSGSISATSGTIGGFTIASSTISSTNVIIDSANEKIVLGSGNDVVIANALDATYRIWVGNTSPASASFRVTKGGVLTATGATISGALTATSGSIGGFTIASSTISSTNLTIDSTNEKIVLGSGTDVIIANAIDSTYRLWVGHTTAASAPFRVSKAGVLTATGASISGGITATSGTIGGFTIGSTSITSTNITMDSTNQYFSLGSGNNIIVLDADDTNYRMWVGNSTASSAPFSVQKDGSVLAKNITATGSITSSVFSKNVATGTAGSVYVTISASVLTSNATATGTTFSISVKGQGGAAPFTSGDYIRLNNGTDTTWATVGAPSGSDPYTYTATYQDGSSTATYTAGQAVIDYGATGDGFLLISADDTYAPFYSVRTWITNPYTGANVTERVRIGNLNNSFGVGSDVYGMAMGDYSSGNYLKYEPVSGFSLVAGNGGIRVDESAVFIGGGSSGWKTGTADSEDSNGGATWLDYSEVLISDDVYASNFADTYSDSTGRLRISDLGISIPTGATITGVVVVVEFKASSALDTGQIYAKLYKAGTLSGTEQNLGYTTGSDTDTIYTFGAPDDLWGTTLSESDVENSGFGVGIRVDADISPSYVYIDQIRLKVFYRTTTAQTLLYMNGNYIDSANFSGGMSVFGTSAVSQLNFLSGDIGDTTTLNNPQNIYVEDYIKVVGGVLIGDNGATTPSSLLHLKSTSPTIRMQDTTSSALSLLVKTDANATVFQEVTALTDILRLDLSSKNVVINSAALATSATDGFLYITSSAGVPTGVPTTFTGRLPIHIDSTNNNFYFYSGGSWRTPTGGSGAPTNSQYVTLATDATLTNERVLTGTSNQITITDNGAGSTVVLSTPQNIHTAATPTFQSMTLSHTAPTLTLTDTTASAKSLLLTVDSNTAQFEEVGGAANDLLVLDLANNVLGIGTASPSTSYKATIGGRLQVGGNVQLSGGRTLYFEGGGTNVFDFTHYYVAARLSLNTSAVSSVFNVFQSTGNIGLWTTTAADHLTFADAKNIGFGSTTGTKIGTATTQKIGFFNATPVVQQGATTDLGTVLSNLGLRASGTAYPITTSGAVTFTGGITINTSGVTITDVDIDLGTTTGTKIGTGTTQKLGFFNATPVAQQGATTDIGTVLSNLGLRASGTAYPISTSGAVRITGTNSFGYDTGAGGTVTQATSKSTGVTLNKTTGQITMNGAALAANTTVSFTLTNSTIGANDILLLNHISAGTAGSYLLNAQSAAGSATINVRNITAGSLSQAIVIAFAVIKGVTS